VTALLLLTVGLVAGVIAAGLGVGGGIIFVPALVLFLDYSQQLAQGTSLAVILPTAVVGAIVHARRGRVIGKLALPIASAGVVGALLGAGLALQLDGLLLRRLFATLLVILALRLLWQTRRSDSSPVDGHVHDAGS